VKLKKILVANRGEIARRIFRTIKELGMDAIAMHSEADRNSLFVKEADESFLLPNGYLDQETIINKAKELKVDAIHPGYGFLSENADFCKKVKDQKIVWIGPDAETIGLMGDKINSKDFCIKQDIPTLQKTSKVSDAKKIGFPILVKASAGGGGKGMRVVKTEKELNDAVLAAKREAKSSFGDDRVFLEKYIQHSRHIEVQILGDNFGNVIHLGERECSIQRRHQKIIEESPSSRLTNKIRQDITSTAVKLAKKLDYKSAGTVEFLFDEDTNEFWFLEVNTRLQVEHPVTEEVTGVDLVKEQIKIASGKKLDFLQEDVEFNGHAIEARLYAENPENDFLPEIGSINKLSCSNNKGIRWDTGIATGDKVTPDYDPMLAKVIAIGETREQSARLLAKELRSTHLAGIKTNKDFLVQCLENNSFLKGKTTSDFIPREHKKLFKAVDKKLLDNAMKASVLWLQEHNKRDNKKLYFLPRNWTNGILPKQDITFEFNDEEYKFQYENNNNHIQIHREHFERLSTSSVLIISVNEEHIHCEIDGISIKAFISCFHDEITINSGSGDLVFKVLPKFIDPNEIIIEGSLTAPMPGKILNINVKKGSSVKTGETLLILEAMKMEHTIKANSDGQVIELYVKTGDQVESGSDLMKIE
tara:strand:- start:2370 stop:4307 length:1938 start_codon:yes stop_codon:yes gene_type:complete